MEFGAPVLSLGRAIAYKINSLTERYLQEVGASPLSTFSLHIYTLIPAVVWSLIFIRPGDIASILATPHQVVYFLIIFVIWNAQQLIHSYRVNSTSTVAALSTLYQLLTLPLLLLVGIFFNHDNPNAASLVAIGFLMLAMLVKPAHHKDNKRARFSKPAKLIVGLVIIEACIDAVLIGLCRQLLKEIPPEVFIGVFDTLVIFAALILVAYLSRRQPVNLIIDVKRHPFRAASVPIIFFIGTVMEFYAQSKLPIYVVFAIGAVTFIMDISSDLFRRRIKINAQTIMFIGLVLAGIICAVFAA